MDDRQPTVLYVDDNPKSRRLLASVLQNCGFKVITAADSVEALSQFRDTSVDLALVDCQMPQLSGAELAGNMKGINPDVPVVMISGCAVPAFELCFVDAHFGPGTAFD